MWTGALTLPPRRLAQQELPVGGYADVTTRGHVDHILPSQFALDDWDFLRRYAEHELLYFRREEPHEQTRHELVVLLDQGVRTWGDVRLVLGAALLALGKQAVDRKLPFRVATTTSPGSLDPTLDQAARGLTLEPLRGVVGGLRPGIGDELEAAAIHDHEIPVLLAEHDEGGPPGVRLEAEGDLHAGGLHVGSP